jgi:hypothetical protein
MEESSDGSVKSAFYLFLFFILLFPPPLPLFTLLERIHKTSTGLEFLPHFYNLFKKNSFSFFALSHFRK